MYNNNMLISIDNSTYMTPFDMLLCVALEMLNYIRAKITIWLGNKLDVKYSFVLSIFINGYFLA